MLNSDSLPIFPKPSANKYLKYVNMLEGFTKKLLKDPVFAVIFKNPFKNLRGGENFEEGCIKLG